MPRGRKSECKNKRSVLLQHLTSGVKIVDVCGSIVGECLSDLIKQIPQLEEMLFDMNGKLLKYIDVYINEESAYLEELAKTLDDGDELYIMNIIAGG